MKKFLKTLLKIIAYFIKNIAQPIFITIIAGVIVAIIKYNFF